VVWVSRLRVAGRERLTAEECPVSATAPESWGWLEEFATRRRLGVVSEPLEWPARRVDAMGVLAGEMETWVRNQDAERG
jgi:hypothetical protein